MGTLTFQDMAFRKSEDGLVVTLYNLYSFPIPEDSIEAMGPYVVDGPHSITFRKLTQEKAERRFSQHIAKHIKDLVLTMNKVPAVYIHRGSGIPLIGSNYFGLVDRGTNIIEVKPFTGCNLNCVYCSVDEGRNSKKVTNYIVEEEYIVEEFRKLAKIKECDQLEAHIGGQAEPSLYSRLPDLIADLAKIPEVKTISIDTNGMLLSGNRKLLDTLIDAGLTRINLSLNAIDPVVANKMAGVNYPIDKVLKAAKYVDSRIKLIIAPTLVPGFNEEEMPKIIEFAKSIRDDGSCPPVRIQNFLEYPFGRNPAKSKDFDWFFAKLKVWETKHGVKLTMMDDDTFVFMETKKLPKPMKRGQIVSIELLMPGRRKGEMLGKAFDRIVSLRCTKRSGTVRGKIARTKHNIFTAKL